MAFSINENRMLNATLFFFSIGIIYTTRNFPFYWDNIVQLSLPATWYFENNFKTALLPDGIGTGHPPFIAAYFSLLWKLFGKSLLVSHLAMFPFVFGLLYQIKELLRNLGVIHIKLLYVLLAFVALDATILSQLSLLTFDVIQLFFLFLCVNAILKERKILLSLAFLFLIFVSLRSMFSACGIVIFHFFLQYANAQKISWRSFLTFLPGLFALAAFFTFFYIEKGWIAYDSGGTYSNHAGFASFKTMVRNAAVFLWRLLDFGRIGVFVLFVFVLLKFKELAPRSNNTIKVLFLLLLSQLLVFLPITIPFQNPFGHRYLMPIIIPLTLLTVYCIGTYWKRPKLWLGLALVCLISGHFWRYPEGISQGWDATTLHWNYLSVSNKMKGYISSSEIDASTIGTFFPNYHPMKLRYLADTTESYKLAKVASDEFLLYSNAFNVSDSELALIQKENQWVVLKEFKQNGVFIRLLKKVTF